MARTVSRHRRPVRRGGWIAVGIGIALVAVVGTGVVVLGAPGGGCATPALTLTVAASPDQAPVMSRLADDWNADEPTVGGRCAGVAVEAMDSSTLAATLSPAWDEERDGTPPDVWAPESSIWPAVAAAQPDVAGLLPEAPPPSLASSPVVLAMQEPMAQVLGWPDGEVGWTQLLGAFAGGQTWEQFGHPEWGPLQLGLPDPTRSTAGLGGILTAVDRDGDDALSDEELLGAIALTQLVTVEEEETGALLAGYTGAEAEANELPAAFPVLERDLAVHAADGPAVPLVPVYPAEGVVVADYPYLTLRAPWVDGDRAELATRFAEHLQGPSGQQAYAEAGFRDAAQSAAGAPLLDPALGFPPDVEVPVRVPDPDGLGEILGMWPVLVRPNNLLIVVDTSGSMANAVPDTDLTRLQLLQDAALQGIGLLSPQTSVGLWEFSTQLTPTTPYRELVPAGPVGEELGPEYGGVDRTSALAGAILQLQAQGGTGLYDTVHDAYLAMHESWQPDAQNLLVVITDGRDEDHDGRSLPELLDALAEAVQPDRPLPIIAMAVGPEADAAPLEEITQVTGGRTVIARDEVDAIQQVVLAFAGRIS